jgi:hypothetical protein
MATELLPGMDKYKIASYCCHYYAFYNSRYAKHKARAGIVKYNGRELFGTYETVPRANNYTNDELHSWVVNDNGEIIDWVINYYAKRTDKVAFTPQEIEEMGFQYIPYTNESAVVKKLKKQFSPVIEKNQDAEMRWSDWAKWWKSRWATAEIINDFKAL